MKLPHFIDIILPIVRFTFGIRVVLNPVFPAISYPERELLTKVRPLIADEFVGTFDEHVAKVNFTQRQSGDRLTVLFRWMFPGWYQWKRQTYFDPKVGVKRLLNFKMIFPNGEELHGNLVSIDGVFCNISFSESLGFFKKYKDFEVVAKKGSIMK